MTPPQLYCSAFSGTPHRCYRVCVCFDCVSWYFVSVWDVLQVFIKFLLKTGHGASRLATDIYWKTVEKLWTSNLRAPFSDCPNIPCTVLFGELGTGDPALLMCMILVTINTFELIHKIRRVYVVDSFLSILYIIALIHSIGLNKYPFE